MAKPTHFHDWQCVVSNVNKKQYGQRIVPMKVLMLGLPRTGTESTTNALKRLGIYQFYHGWLSIFNNPRDNEMWLEALEAKFDNKGDRYTRKEWDKLLGDCQGVSDLPAILFAEDLIQAYPEAKVIITHRDFDTWYDSCLDTIETRVNHPLSKSLIPITYLLRLHSRFTRPTWIKAWSILMKGDFRRNARNVYESHSAYVKSLVPPERLLEYNVKQGWDPLLRFLDLADPGVPFPRGNQKDVFIKRFEKALLLTLGAIFQRTLYLTLAVLTLSYVTLSMLSR
ncbi:hypothetical protein K490DRAFT_43230 [Saccharata proteae CBS 121410]|uniref:NAD dependent epimerase/dehydratase n=1 Tax=Saccharata proteae CBS 121410 TaxID=1314787 RepID=A0A9P4HXG0_9PEZI|nr:hypothetical protein K490DRAFT_43230 [Saccharata proteae CBS 121410]